MSVVDRVCLTVVGRGGASEYYYSRGGTETKPDRGRNYDGEADQRDGRRRSVHT